MNLCAHPHQTLEKIFTATLKALLTFLEHVDFIFQFYTPPKHERQSPTLRMTSKCTIELKFQGTFRNVKKHCGIQQE